MGVREGDDLLALLVFVPRRAHALAPFGATGLVPSPWSTRTSRVFSAARAATRAMHAGQSDPASAHGAQAL
jgi:hypothetical protein